MNPIVENIIKYVGSIEELQKENAQLKQQKYELEQVITIIQMYHHQFTTGTPEYYYCNGPDCRNILVSDFALSGCHKHFIGGCNWFYACDRCYAEIGDDGLYCDKCVDKHLNLIKNAAHNRNRKYLCQECYQEKMKK